MPKALKTKGKALVPKKVDGAEEFAYAYIRLMGNGTQAAVEVFGLEPKSASVHASRMLRDAKVQEVIGTYLDAQRESFKKFTEQGAFLLTIVTQRLIEIVQDPGTPIPQAFEAMERLVRIGGFEIAEGVEIEKIRSKAIRAGGRAQIPGVPAPGTQPGLTQGDTNIDARKVFILAPPPIPQGGVPTPAQLAQWASGMGGPINPPAPEGARHA